MVPWHPSEAQGTSNLFRNVVRQSRDFKSF